LREGTCLRVGTCLRDKGSGLHRKRDRSKLPLDPKERFLQIRAGRGQVGPCLTDVAHRPLPACCSRGAATLKPEQLQQR
jgi:hypothetical protein